MYNVIALGLGEYCIAGNFGEVFNLVNWRFCGKSPNFKSANIISCTIALCGGACKSPNLKSTNAFC